LIQGELRLFFAPAESAANAQQDQKDRPRSHLNASKFKHNHNHDAREIAVRNRSQSFEQSGTHHDTNRGNVCARNITGKQSRT
jgi:hypothetical protein